MAGNIPPINELREVCQACKIQRDKRFWYTFTRRFSIYITWLLLHTKVSANQVSQLIVFLAFCGSIFLSFKNPLFSLFGTFLYISHHVMDKVDGEIARYRKVFSIEGVYLDELAHLIAFAGIFTGLGLHVYSNTKEAIFLIFAMFGAVFMILVRANKNIPFLLFSQYAMRKPDLLKSSPLKSSVLTREAAHVTRSGQKTNLTFFNKIIALLRDFVLMISQFTIMLLFIVLGVVYELVYHDTVLLQYLLKIEMILQGAVLLSLVYINYTVNVKTECLRLQRLSGLMQQQTNSLQD